MLSRPKNPKIAALLAFLGIVIPIAGFHKFYLGQPIWGLVYLLLSLGTPIPKIASAIEGVWYLAQHPDEFDENFNVPGSSSPVDRVGRWRAVAAAPVRTVADDLRELDQLRQDGLISEYEFEQKRRQLINRV